MNQKVLPQAWKEQDKGIREGNLFIFLPLSVCGDNDSQD